MTYHGIMMKNIMIEEKDFQVYNQNTKQEWHINP